MTARCSVGEEVVAAKLEGDTGMDAAKYYDNLVVSHINNKAYNLRNVHCIMVIGGLYPPTDTPPPLKMDCLSVRLHPCADGGGCAGSRDE